MARSNETENKMVFTAEDRTRAAAQSAKRNLGEVDGAVLGLRSSFASLSKLGVGGGILGAATAGVAGLTLLAKSAADTQDEFYKMSQRVGVSTETLSGWAYAARLADVSQEELGIGLKQLSKNLVAGDEAFAALHITTKNSEEAFLQIADRFAQMEDGAGKTALAMRIFGKAGADLIPLLNEGSAGIRKLAKEAEDLGLIVGTDSAKAAEEFNDNLERMGARVDGLKLKIGNELIPMVNKLWDAIASVPEDAEDAIVGFFDKIAPAAEAGFGRAERASESFWRSVGNNKLAAAAAARAAVHEANAKRTAEQAKINDALGGGDYIDGSSYIPGFDVSPKKQKAPIIVSDSERTAAAKKAADERIWIAKLQAEAEEQFEKDKYEAWDFYNKMIGKEKEENLQRDQNRHQILLDLYDEETAAAEEAERAAGLAANKGKSMLQTQEDELKKGTDVAREFGLTFNSALEDAITNWEDIGSVMRAFAKDLVKLGVRKYLTEPMMEMFDKMQKGGGTTGGGSGGGGFMNFFGSLFSSGGGAAGSGAYEGLSYGAAEMGSSYIGAYAEGGRPPVGRPSMVGERGPELFWPDAAGTIVPNDKLGGGNPVSVYNTYNIDSRADRADIIREIKASEKRTIAQVQDLSRRSRLKVSD